MNIRIGAWHISITKTPQDVESWNKHLLKWARRNYTINSAGIYLDKIALIKKARDIWHHDDTNIPRELRQEVFSLRNLKENICDVLEQALRNEGKL